MLMLANSKVLLNLSGLREDETGLFASLVSSTFDNPTIVLSIPETVPVNVGEFNGAFRSKAVELLEKLVCSHRWYCPHFLIQPSLYQFLKPFL
jgi:hypothetical protein